MTIKQKLLDREVMLTTDIGKFSRVIIKSMYNGCQCCGDCDCYRTIPNIGYAYDITRNFGKIRHLRFTSAEDALGVFTQWNADFVRSKGNNNDNR